MLLEIFKYLVEKLGVPLILIFGTAYFTSLFKKNKKAIDNDIEKPNTTINNPNTINIINIYNNQELPK